MYKKHNKKHEYSSEDFERIQEEKKAKKRLRFQQKQNKLFLSLKEKSFVYKRDYGYCRACGELVPFPGLVLMRIPPTEANRKKYGDSILRNPINCVLTCGKQKCVDLLIATPEEEEAIVNAIHVTEKKYQEIKKKYNQKEDPPCL